MLTLSFWKKKLIVSLFDMSSTDTGSGPHALGSMPVQYGDFVQISTISAFLRPEGRTQSRDMQHELDDIEALAKAASGNASTNFIGLYYKPSGSVRLAVPPIGKAATGTFTPSIFQLVDPHETDRNPSYGRSVKYGDPVVLIDENGNALNNKVGGFFEGYIGPKARGKSGECFVSFHTPGKERLPMQYGDAEVSIQVDESHRHRTSYNCRLSNYKSYSSKVVGGYVVCDGSGSDLTFTLHKSKASHRRSTATPISKDDVPAMNSISLVRNKREVRMVQRPQYMGAIRLSDVRSDDRLRITFAKTSTPDHCGKKLLPVRPQVELSARTFSKGSHWTLLKVNGPAPFMVRLAWSYEDTSATKSAAEMGGAPKASRGISLAEIAFAIAKLAAVYVVCVVALTLAEPHLAAYLESVPFYGMCPFPIVGATYICFLADLLSPSLAFRGSSGAGSSSSSGSTLNRKRSKDYVDKTLVLSINPEEVITTQARKLWASTATLMEDVSDDEEEVKETFYDEGGVDERGVPRHPAFKRFLNGEHGKMGVALKRWKTTTEWRRENDVDNILEKPHPHFEVIKANYPHYFTARAKDGYVLYIEQPGRVKMKPMRKAGCKLKDLLWHYLYITEFMWKMVEPAEKGRTITVLDVKGIGIFDFAGEVVDFVKKCSKFTGEHYPERSFRIFIINVPRWFMTVYNIAKAWVAPETLQKIVICRNTSYQEKLRELVDPAVLPEKYGGDCTVPLPDTDLEKMLRNNVYKHLVRTKTPLTGGVRSLEEMEAMLDDSIVTGVSHMSEAIPEP